LVVVDLIVTLRQYRLAGVTAGFAVYANTLAELLILQLRGQ
jgi:hypothetical protein